jgi:peptidoglycan/xylan/chitin deacetylase (PgdA/CDA1 family)
MSLWTRIPKSLQRRLPLWLARNPYRINLSSPIVSFTFDDFPCSALRVAGPILRERGFYGTYYTSFGLMGTTTPTGEIFVRDDIDLLVSQQHELACHTCDHSDSWGTDSAAFEDSVVRNQRGLAQLVPRLRMTSLSYPISWPRPGTKRRVARHYPCARGCGQTFNHGSTDLNYLKAFFIEQSREDFDAIRSVIDANARANGWLIFATHDVCDSPTRYGCVPALFEKIVDYTAKSGAAVLTVDAAFRKITGQTQPVAAPVAARSAANGGTNLVVESHSRN